MIPNTYIVGATKCATSTMHYILSKHPDICCSNPKESNVIDVDYQNAADKYQKYFSHYDGESVVVDANPNLFVVPYAAERIHMLDPDAKIIIMLRDPYDRLISHWKYFASMRPGREYMDVNLALEANRDDFSLDKFYLEGDYVPTVCKEWGNYRRMYLETGCYEYYMKEYWLNTFDSSNVLVIVTEDLEINKPAEIERVCDFLEVEYVPGILEARDRNVSKFMSSYASEKINMLTHIFLIDLYSKQKNFVQQFAKINLDKYWK